MKKIGVDSHPGGINGLLFKSVRELLTLQWSLVLNKVQS